MLLYMICPKMLALRLRDEGELASHPRGSEEVFDARAYEWMRRQMRKRIPDYRGSSIWWTWYRIDGVTGKKPDLRNRSRWHWGVRGEEWVRLELDVPSGEVLLSDVDLWHFVLGNWYLAFNEQESERWYALHPQPEPGSGYDATTQSLLEQSWERIFEFDTTLFDPNWLSAGGTIQGCFEILRWRDVQAVTEFVNRPVRLD